MKLQGCYPEFVGPTIDAMDSMARPWVQAELVQAVRKAGTERFCQRLLAGPVIENSAGLLSHGKQAELCMLLLRKQHSRKRRKVFGNPDALHVDADLGGGMHGHEGEAAGS